MFRILSGKGFHIEFPNGVVLSTQIGAGNYCDNYDEEIGNFPKCRAEVMPSGRNYSSCDNVASTNAEIAIWDTTRNEKRPYLDKEGSKWITEEMMKELFPDKGDDQVMGYVSMEDWLKIFEWCKNYKLSGKG